MPLRNWNYWRWSRDLSISACTFTEKPNKLLTDHQALEPLIKRNGSNNTCSARLTRWLDRLAHFSINVSHIAGRHLAVRDSLSRNSSAPLQANDAYEEEYVINSIILHYKFMTKYGCLSTI